MLPTVPLTVFGKGVIKLNWVLLPISLLLLIYISIMAGGSPGSQGITSILATVSVMVFLGPAALVLLHVLVAKLLDSILRLVPTLKDEVSWFGIVLSSIIVVFLGNWLVDDFYQLEKGNYVISISTLCLDVGGMALVIVSGGGRIPKINCLL
ncbi:MAG: hypothetical protein HQL78_13365 [Magnetococcales bacterium]|nr:hypothetical protein [Magnetococcales bacterium]